MKKILRPFSLAVLSLAFSVSNSISSAAVDASSSSGNTTSNSSQLCDSARQSLKTVQKSDSYARSYLGHSYGLILTNYIVPMNLRLTVLNRPDAALSSLQSDFVSARTKFNNDYVAYSRSLEELLLVNCDSDLEKFIHSLKKVRENRSVVENDTILLDSLAKNYLKSAKSLEASL